jgi:hypothetical protein
MLLTAALVWLTSPWWSVWQGAPHHGGPVSLRCRQHASPGVGGCYWHHLSAPRTSLPHGYWGIWRSETERNGKCLADNSTTNCTLGHFYNTTGCHIAEDSNVHVLHKLHTPEQCCHCLCAGWPLAVLSCWLSWVSCCACGTYMSVGSPACASAGTLSATVETCICWEMVLQHQHTLVGTSLLQQRSGRSSGTKQHKCTIILVYGVGCQT